MSGSLGPMPQGVPGGGLPPGMTAPPANLGGVTIPQSNPGNIKGAIEKLHGALQLINDAMHQIPIGTPLYTATSDIATKLSKHIGEVKEDAQSTIQTMLQAIQQMKQNPQLAALHQGGAAPGQPSPQPPAIASAPSPAALAA